MTEFTAGASEDLPTGRNQIRAEFDYDGGGLAKDGNGRIAVVQIDVGDHDHSHLSDPAEVARVATSRQ